MAKALKVPLSNRARRIVKKAQPAAPRNPPGDATVRVSKEPPPPEPTDRDGLLWEARKSRLTKPQLREGLHYRALIRAPAAGAAKVSDLLAIGGGGGGSMLGGSYGDAAAQLELFVIRAHLLGNEPDLILVMDGVCGMGHTLRYLAAGKQVRAHELMSALRIALNLMVASRVAKEAAAKARQGPQQKAA